MSTPCSPTGDLSKLQLNNSSPRQEFQKRRLTEVYRAWRARLARKFMLSDNRMAGFEPLPAIFPGHMAPIIKQSSDGERELVTRSWGFILLRDGYAPKG